MKKKLLILCSLILIVATGCFKNNEENALKDLEKKYKNLKTYHVVGELEIVNNEDIFKYDVDVLFKKDDKYKVTLTNQNNDHEQIILKNTEGVYVLTPSLNKSFKFQSNWPYNNSQVYLLTSIIDDIKNDKERSFTENSDGFKFTTSVNYPNNRKLVNQVVSVDKNLVLKTVEVQDENGITYMKMKFNEIDLSLSIDDNTFRLENIMKNMDTNNNTSNNPENNSNNNTETGNNTNDTNNNSSETSTLEDVIYPLYLPSGTQLTSQETVKKDNGERVIMTFDGEKSFILVEETASIAEEFEIIPTLGEPCILTDTVAALTDTSITWNSGNVDYYLVSDVISQEELLDIARSISVIPTMK